MAENVARAKTSLQVRDIGGIDETDVAFEPGVNVLSGRNATNRTSLLQAIMAGLGSDDATIKADASEGRVELVVDGAEFTRTLERRNGETYGSGDPYLDETTLGDLFAFLLESNEARRAVVTDADLRDLMMQPVDREEIDRLLDRRCEVTEELEEILDLETKLPRWRNDARHCRPRSKRPRPN